MTQTKGMFPAPQETKSPAKTEDRSSPVNNALKDEGLGLTNMNTTCQ